MSKYVVVAANGYWGKGKTALEAAKNAKIGGSYIYAEIFKHHEVIEDFTVTMGGIAWQVTKDFYEDCSGLGDARYFQIESLLTAAIQVGRGKTRIVKGKLVCLVEVE